jgi:hypothetical protein
MRVQERLKAASKSPTAGKIIDEIDNLGTLVRRNISRLKQHQTGGQSMDHEKRPERMKELEIEDG